VSRRGGAASFAGGQFDEGDMMASIQIDLSEIAELGTQVAINGALRAGEVQGVDDLFEFLVGIAILIYEIAP
jgi:hypothetical protein